MKLLDDYFEIVNKIHEYFGYQEQWAVYSFEDSREYYWYLTRNNVYFADTLEELKTQNGMFYSNEIFKQRHLPKAVYETPDYTMIVVDTNTDGNKFLQIFDNKLKQKAEDMENEG